MGFRGLSYYWARKNDVVLLFSCCNLEFNGRVVNVDYWKSGHINNRCFGEVWLLKMEGGFKEDIDKTLYYVQNNGSENQDGFEDDFNDLIHISFFILDFAGLKKNLFIFVCLVNKLNSSPNVFVNIGAQINYI